MTDKEWEELTTLEILEDQPMWVRFMIWGNFVDTHKSPEHIRAFYGYPRILTHEDFTASNQRDVRSVGQFTIPKVRIPPCGDSSL